MMFRLGELFCGPGGIGWAASKSRYGSGKKSLTIKHQWAVDIDPDSCETFRKNIPGATEDSVFCEDARGLKLKKLGEIDALAFGFPCNDFSLVGERKGLKGKYGPLYQHGIRILKTKQPRWFLAENVGGLRAENSGRVLENILREMEEAGYELTPHLYHFEDYGIPQRRHRIIIVGIHRDEDLKFTVPAPSYESRTAREAIEIPPIPASAGNQELTRQSERVIERLKHIKQGKNAFNSEMPSALKLNVHGATLSNIYKRLDPDKPSYTVTGSGGGGTHVYHWHEPRALTNRERARLQTFPDNFEFYGSKESVRRQIGMAVPPDGAKIILTAILKTFAGVRYSSIPENITRQQYLYHHGRQAI